MGASMALASFLSYDGAEPLGGVISLYGINPLDWSKKQQTTLQEFVSSRTPILLMNNIWLLNSWDIDYTAKHIHKLYKQSSGKGADIFESIMTSKMGTAPSNLVDSQVIARRDTNFLEQTRDLTFGIEQHAKILSFFEKNRVNDGIFNIDLN